MMLLLAEIQRVMDFNLDAISINALRGRPFLIAIASLHLQLLRTFWGNDDVSNLRNACLGHYRHGCPRFTS